MPQQTPPLERPPYIDLLEAVRAAKEIHVQGGGSVSLEILSGILGNSVKSSSFQRKLSALRAYGFADMRGNGVVLTPLAMKVVAPTSPNEENDAMHEAARNIAVFRTLHERYSGGVLPGRDMLANVLLREYNATDPLHRQWTDFFIATLRAAGLLGSAGGRVTVQRRPSRGPETASVADASPPMALGEGTAALPALRAQGTGHVVRPGDDPARRFELPLGLDGRVVVMLPTAPSGPDFDDLIAMIQVMKRRAERQQTACTDQGGPEA
jgi:hypothetical protein